jgi:acetyl esterase
MPLPPDVAEFVARIRAAGRLPVERLPLAEARAALAYFGRVQSEPPPIAAVEAVQIPRPAGPLAARLYRPTTAPDLPAIVFLHGGGWVLGDLDLTDAVCRELAAATDAAVISVDYRLAPEHPFPAAFDDAVAATTWVLRVGASLGLDPARTAVAGESAGGNLAAATALALRGSSPPLAAQLLICPVLDGDFETGSHRTRADDELLPDSTLRWFWEQYAGGDQHRQDPRACPLSAQDLSGAAPTFVATCEFDPVRDEGLAYAKRLSAARVPVEVNDYAGLVHGALLTLAITPSARVLFDDLAAAARRLLAKPSEPPVA